MPCCKLRPMIDDGGDMHHVAGITTWVPESPCEGLEPALAAGSGGAQVWNFMTTPALTAWIRWARVYALNSNGKSQFLHTPKSKKEKAHVWRSYGESIPKTSPIGEKIVCRRSTVCGRLGAAIPCQCQHAPGIMLLPLGADPQLPVAR